MAKIQKTCIPAEIQKLVKKNRILMRMGPSDAEFHAEFAFITPGMIRGQKRMIKDVFHVRWKNIFPERKMVITGVKIGPIGMRLCQNVQQRARNFFIALPGLEKTRKSYTPYSLDKLFKAIFE